MKLIPLICLILITQNSFGQFVGTPYIIKRPATVSHAPTIGTAKGGDAEATVAFTIPANDGGGVISSYTVNSNPNGITATGTSSPITITGLTNGTTYTFTVTATNSAGSSTASAASNSVTPSSIPTVTSSTGKIWMDRNLGASQVAISKTDSEAYGDLYQWGRAADGHQIRTSSKTNIQSSTNQPADMSFIYNFDDWRSPENTNLWQGVNGVNNPCPSGFRLPTIAEWEAERKKWSSNNANGAFASLLKLPIASYRNNINGIVDSSFAWGYYSSSTIDKNSQMKPLRFSESSGVTTNTSVGRARGLSVRCIKN